MLNIEHSSFAQPENNNAIAFLFRDDQSNLVTNRFNFASEFSIHCVT